MWHVVLRPALSGWHLWFTMKITEGQCEAVPWGISTRSFPNLNTQSKFADRFEKAIKSIPRQNLEMFVRCDAHSTGYQFSQRKLLEGDIDLAWRLGAALRSMRGAGSAHVVFRSDTVADAFRKVGLRQIGRKRHSF